MNTFIFILISASIALISTVFKAFYMLRLKKVKKTFTAGDTALLKTIGRQVTISILNARLSKESYIVNQM
ncbi:MAG: hypothetical protein KJ838_03450, partial [Candidatus Omnitrophica bacterium]|nr:hypothetical protein [Candidatus Omnitrophota bacterium]